jgi:hypothetical protein
VCAGEARIINIVARRVSLPGLFMKHDHTFYTNQKQSAIMEPRFYSIAAYEDEIRKQQQELKAIHKKQFENMLKNDGATVDALEKQYKATEKEISDLRHELGEVMGANVHGKQGNQLLDDEKWGGYAPEEDEQRGPNKGNALPTGNAAKPGLQFTSSKPQFAVNDVPVHVTGLDDVKIKKDRAVNVKINKKTKILLIVLASVIGAAALIYLVYQEIMDAIYYIILNGLGQN